MEVGAHTVDRMLQAPPLTWTRRWVWWWPRGWRIFPRHIRHRIQSRLRCVTKYTKVPRGAYTHTVLALFLHFILRVYQRCPALRGACRIACLGITRNAPGRESLASYHSSPRLSWPVHRKKPICFILRAPSACPPSYTPSRVRRRAFPSSDRHCCLFFPFFGDGEMPPA
ncbi:hypothetical protein LZ31DRAFT_12818 [Colletotrichum somersetense]|nr:hypothetical protein LZ31DRAFT_12818 [Colletotrichum somersetense]